MISIAPTKTGFGFVDFLMIIALFSLFYLAKKDNSIYIYISYIYLSCWLGILQIPFAIAWNHSWTFIGDLLILIFFLGCKIIQSILLILVIKPALITAITTKGEGIAKS